MTAALVFLFLVLTPAAALALHLDLDRAAATYVPRHRAETGNLPCRRPELRGSNERISR